MNNSLFGQLNARDLVNGVIVAFLTACLTSIVTILDSGVLPDLAQLKAAGLSGLVAALAYLTKNLVTNSQGQVGKTE
jgi:hypothetical protein